MSPLYKKGIEDLSHVLFQCLKKTNTRTRLQITLNGCKAHSFKYQYLDVRQKIIMNVDFEDPLLTQKLAKFSLIFIKKVSNRKNSKNIHRHTNTDLHYDQVKGKPSFVETVNLFSQCSFTCLIFSRDF